MGVKIEKLATSQLMTYQQVIGMANEQMDQFATNMEEFAKQKKISEAFAKEMFKELQPKVEANNKILSEIERELYDRAKRDFPGATLPNAIGKYFKRYYSEVENQAKINADIAKSIQKGELVTEKPVVKPNFKTEE